MATILVVDDDPQIRSLLRDLLGQAGHQVHAAADGRVGLERARHGAWDLVVLDVLLPDISGFEVCRLLRRSSAVPVLMLTGMGDEVDKVSGLDSGADDYLTKPFGHSELLARVRALLRRTSLMMPGIDSATGEPVGTLSCRGIELDLIARKAHRDGRYLALKPREFDLLAMLVSRPGHIFSSEDLVRTIWGFEDLTDTRTVAVHIRRLRERLEKDPSRPEIIETVRGTGYRFATKPT